MIVSAVCDADRGVRNLFEQTISERWPKERLQILKKALKKVYECRGRGHVTRLAAANNYISVVTSRGWLLRYDLSEGEAPGKRSPRLDFTVALR